MINLIIECIFLHLNIICSYYVPSFVPVSCFAQVTEFQVNEIFFQVPTFLHSSLFEFMGGYKDDRNFCCQNFDDFKLNFNWRPLQTVFSDPHIRLDLYITDQPQVKLNTERKIGRFFGENVRYLLGVQSYNFTTQVFTIRHCCTAARDALNSSSLCFRTVFY